MCGRFVRAKMPEVYAKAFDLLGVPKLAPSYNVAPTQQVLVARVEDGHRVGVAMRWGLIPFWAKDKKTIFINSRSETVLEKPAFKAAVKRRRCLVLADGYYEWKPIPPSPTGRGVGGEGKCKKQPYYFRPANDEPFAFAGIWDTWKGEGESIESCSILTIDANDLSRPVHDRMPVWLTGANTQAWLDPDIEDLAQLASMLRPFPAEDMTCYAVGTQVNNVRNNDPSCLERVA